MRGRDSLTRIAIATVVAALASASLALAGPVDTRTGHASTAAEHRMSIGTYLKGVNKARDRWSPSLFIVLRSPADYKLENSGGPGQGTWEGPRYEVAGDPNVGGNATLSFNVTFEFDTANPRAALQKNLIQDWPEVERGSAPIAHIVGGRNVGSIASSWRLGRSNFSSNDAQFEGNVAVPMCGAFVIARLSALEPDGDVTASGPYKVKGTIAPKTWNRDQVVAAIKAVRLQGPLPVFGVVAKAVGRSLRGTVRDCHKHPVPLARVALQRRSGSTWSVVRSGKASASGAFVLGTTGAGTYRVASGAKASAPVSIR